MSHSLGTTTHQVDVGDPPRAKGAQPFDRPLGRDVDMAVDAARRRGDEEHAPATDPGGELVVDLVEDLAHLQRLLSAKPATKGTLDP